MGRFNPVIFIRSSRSNRSPRARALFGACAGVLFLCAAAVSLAQDAKSDQKADTVLRVCADANNMPLSNDRGEGYENKIAEALAKDLGRTTQYTFFPQRMGFVRNTLRNKDPQTQEYKCDVIIGVPSKYE